MEQVIVADPSMGDLRSMIASTDSTPVVESKPVTSEKAEPVSAEETSQAASEPADKVTEPVETDEPLPENVQKRIAKEVERQGRADREIAKAVSERKAREAELAKLKETDAPGSEPAQKTPQASASDKPQRPKFGEKGHENESYDKFEARQAEHDEKLTTWIQAEALKGFETKQAQQQAQAKHEERMKSAIEKHGPDFPAMTDTVCAVAPVEMQVVIGNMRDWDSLAAHLSKQPAQLKELAKEFAANPYETTIKLGRIRDQIVSKEPIKATTEKPLPEPLAKVGGNATATGKDLQAIAETGSMSQLRAAVKKAQGG